MSIVNNLQTVRKSIALAAEKCNRNPDSISLLAVSKRHSVESIREAMEAGQKLFGENYIQEALKKKESIPEASFHFIGHLQSNKAKFAASAFSMIETVDSMKLVRALHKHLVPHNRNMDILIQVNIGNDPNKSGIKPDQAMNLLTELTAFPHIRTRGLMTIPPFNISSEKTRECFQNLRKLSMKCAGKGLFADNDNVTLSMGMSHDFSIAIEEGATLLRIGTAIFGSRPGVTK